MILRAVFLASFFVLVGAFPTAAQQPTIVIGSAPDSGPAPFGGSGAAPISRTTVLQFLLEPRDSGGGRLAYAIAIRGASEWYQQRTTWDATDSIPGFQAVNWNVGQVRYVVAYDAKGHRLRTFGKEIDLTRANLVLVTLGSAGAADATVSAERRIAFVMLTPGGFVQAFLANVPEVRSFAGIQ